ncbi:hypothetical protein H5410_024367 [Solanum commersonii]|uniref:Uncharacterized protein n=1 Tax=Solanum commersonii TaxID=4109 RepID=A0A9J5ZLU8_SOLCO|nr:hypothetical protein H5410_024367 [Solanum commersonii]
MVNVAYGHSPLSIGLSVKFNDFNVIVGEVLLLRDRKLINDFVVIVEGSSLGTVMMEERIAVKQAVTTTTTHNHVVSTSRDRLLLIDSPMTTPVDMLITASRIHNFNLKAFITINWSLLSLGLSVTIMTSPESI